MFFVGNRIMKEVGDRTRVSPQVRQEAVARFAKRIAECPKAR